MSRMRIFCLCIFHLILVAPLLGIKQDLGQPAVLPLRAFRQSVQTSGLRARTPGSKNALRKPTTLPTERDQLHPKVRLGPCPLWHMALTQRGTATRRPILLPLRPRDSMDKGQSHRTNQYWFETLRQPWPTCLPHCRLRLPSPVLTSMASSVTPCRTDIDRWTHTGTDTYARAIRAHTGTDTNLCIGRWSRACPVVSDPILRPKTSFSCSEFCKKNKCFDYLEVNSQEGASER